MNGKEALIAKVNSIKEFELKEVAVNQDGAWIADPNCKAVCVKDETEIITAVSSRYKLIQFSSCFNPVLEKMPDNIVGDVWTYKGKAQLSIFPEAQGQADRVGITLKNSVDRSTAVEARFSVLSSGHYIVFPKEIKGFRKTHTGQALAITQDFMAGLADIRLFWHDLVRKYNDFALDGQMVEDILKELRVTKGLADRITNHKTTNLWEMFQATLHEISLKHYRSDIHKAKKVETIVKIFYNFAMMSRI
jgi:hypothetical protein